MGAKASIAASAIRVPSVSPRRGVAEVAGVEWPDKGLCREAFIDQVSSSGIAHYRDLPWRHIDDPYAVLVSEVMLQQTQVARVERFWRRFLGAFPTVDALAAASASDVLEMWQGGSVITVGRFPSARCGYLLA